MEEDPNYGNTNIQMSALETKEVYQESDFFSLHLKCLLILTQSPQFLLTCSFHYRSNFFSTHFDNEVSVNCDICFLSL